MISNNLSKVRQNMLEASKRSGRDVSDVQLIAVTKNVKADDISTAISCGVNIVGENRVQEARDKKPLLDEAGVSWHLIGHLQRNKAKMAVELFDMIHSVDNYALAKELDLYSGRIETFKDVLIQVNISGEDSKFGLNPNSLKEFLKELSAFEHIRVKGLMTMAPIAEDAEDIRWVFKEARLLMEELKKLNISNLDLVHLSMGMSHDYQVAIEEGATLIRVGHDIFRA